MDTFLDYLKAFAVGGVLCVIGQLLIDKTKLTPTVPLTGFGNTLAMGVKKAVETDGLLGVFTGGFTASAAGICAAVFFGIIIALIFKPKDKK